MRRLARRSSDDMASILTPRTRLLVRLLVGGAVVLGGTGAFLLGSDGSSAAAAVALTVHIAAGVLLIPVLLAFALPHAYAVRRLSPKIRFTGFIVLSVALTVSVTGVVPLFGEAATPEPLRLTHVLTGFVMILLYAGHRSRGRNPMPLRRFARGVGMLLMMGILLDLWERGDVQGPTAQAQVSLAPAETRTVHGGYADIDAIDDSATCADCHPVITDEWSRSAHRHASMTNPFYKGTIQQMRERYPLESTQWCAGCHDPALLLTGKMDDPDLDFEGREAQVGLSCVACHAIEVRGHEGNGAYDFLQRRTYAWEHHADERVRKAHGVLLRFKPEAHVASLSPKGIDSSEFCATCHKAEVPPEINNWHWLRAQSEYDAWHASGVSMNNSRSFYHPPAARNCQDCHMHKVVDHRDPTADANGMVKSHMFAAANTALPYLRGDTEMIERITDFLRTACRIDVTALEIPQSDGSADPVLLAAGETTVLKPGAEVEAHVVVRTLGVGHRFPGGTIDSNEVWVEFTARMGDDEPFYRSGAIDAETGIVDETAEFYRAYAMDKNGKRVVNRLGPDIRTRVYAKTIPPGAADVVRYRFRVPEGVQGPLRLTARLRYRKFMRQYVDALFPDSKILKHIGMDGKMHDVDLEKLPVVDMTETELAFSVGETTKPAQIDEPYLRVNDLGIGYLLQKDFVRAERAFRRVTELEQDYADGWVNLARVLFERRKFGEVKHALKNALILKPGFPKAIYFQGEAARAELRFEDAARAYREVLRTFPEDRVVLKRLALVLSEDLERPKEALPVIERSLVIDKADPEVWFIAITAYKQLGDAEKLEEAQEKYRFYRRDDTEWQRRGMYLNADPNLDRLAEPIHIHRQK